MSVAALREQLASVGQSRVLRFYDSLLPAGQQRLTAQLVGQDVKLLAALADEYVRVKPQIALPADIKPVKPMPRTPCRFLMDIPEELVEEFEVKDASMMTTDAMAESANHLLSMLDALGKG